MWSRMRKNAFFIVFFAVFTFILFSDQERNSPYNRIIIGDAKAYYAYLPAVFVYQDASFEFVNKIEKKYYPADGSLAKNFMNELPSGEKVNKTFPGLAILYAPFFFLAWVFSALFGYSTDGYSSPFQFAIALSHIFYFTLALRILWSILTSFQIKSVPIFFAFLVLTFGTNCWYYLVYDFSVSHIHLFFLVSLTFSIFMKWLQFRKPHLLGCVAVLLALIAIVRPTTVLLVLFLPFVLLLTKSKIYWSPKLMFGQIRHLIPFVLALSFVLFIPLLLWKWQTGNWFVYSYSNERFDFSKPHFLDFLFSFRKGWLLWSPAILLAFILLFFCVKKDNFKTVVSLVFPFLFIAFVFSCWWIWTFGMGFGQRPMIEFLPFLLIGTLVILNKFKHNFILLFAFVPLLLLSLVQGYQVANFIHIGGNTTREEYERRFFQFKQDAPTFKVTKNFELLVRKTTGKTEVNEFSPYSKSVKVSVQNSTYQVIKIVTKVKSAEKKPNLQLVVSSISGLFYKQFSLSEHVDLDFVELEFGAKLTKLASTDTLLVYVWNGNSKSIAQIKRIEVEFFRERKLSSNRKLLN